MTIQSFCARYGITATAADADRNPNLMSAGDWPAKHWRVTLRRGHPRRALTVFFSQGMAHTGEPKAVDVLDCLLSDASSADNASSFEDWCAEYGYDCDSRKAERTYRTIERQAAKLRQFLGEEYDIAIAAERL